MALISSQECFSFTCFFHIFFFFALPYLDSSVNCECNKIFFYTFCLLSLSTVYLFLTNPQELKMCVRERDRERERKRKRDRVYESKNAQRKTRTKTYIPQLSMVLMLPRLLLPLPLPMPLTQIVFNSSSVY